MASFAPPALLTSALESPPPCDEARVAAALDELPVPDVGDASALRSWVRALRGAALALQRASGTAAEAETLLCRGFDRLLTSLLDALSGGAPLVLAAAGAFGAGRPGLHSRLELVLVGARGAEQDEARFQDALGGALEAAGLAHKIWSGTPESLTSVSVEADEAREVLLDTRAIAGSKALLTRFGELLRREVIERFTEELLGNRVQALRARRLQAGGSVYMLEPELEAGAGGLRDLEAALWMAKVRLGTTGLGALATAGELGEERLLELRWARDTLARARNELQALTGEADAKLEFARQAHVAAAFGFTGKGLAPVERLMRELHLAAAIVARGTDRLTARMLKAGRRMPSPDRRIDHAFSVRAGALVLSDASLLDHSPELLVRAFAVADREGTPLADDSRAVLSGHLSRIDASLRSHPQVLATLRQMFLRPGTRGEFLEEMHAAGVLGALFPELGRIVALYRQDAHHAYTVDVHSLVAVRRLYALRNGELMEREPELTRLASSLSRPLPLFLAALFHDVGRSAEGGHAERGAKLMRQIASRLELGDRDAQDAEFLVRHHLLMSHVSQRRDLSDPQAIETFAQLCGDGDRLLMLYLLTWADLCASAPRVWNDWRARMARELYEKSVAFLAGRYGGTPDHLQRLRERMREALLAHFSAAQVDGFLARMPERYVRTALAEDAVRHFRVLRRARKSSFAAWLRHRQSYTEMTLCARNVPEILSIFTGVLSAHRVDILRAQVFTTSDDHAVAVFAVQQAGGERVDHATWKRARADLVAALAGELDTEALLEASAADGEPRAWSPRSKTRVDLDPASATEATIIDFVADDRPGLLHDVSRALLEVGATVTVAKISTESGRATDSFYVQVDGRRIEDPALLDRIEEAVLRALQGPG